MAPRCTVFFMLAVSSLPRGVNTGPTALSYAECAYRARGRVPPPTLGRSLTNATVSLHTCLGLARQGAGWEPLVSTERGEKRNDDTLTRFWTRLLSSGAPFNASGLPFEAPVDAPADPLAQILRLFAAAARTVRAPVEPLPAASRCATPKPLICVVGDSISRNLASDLELGRAALLGLGKEQLARALGGGDLARVQYFSTTYALDLGTGHHGRCLRLCQMRARRATDWERQTKERQCTVIVAELSSVHFAPTNTTGAFLRSVERAFYDSLHKGAQLDAKAEDTAQDDPAFAPTFARAPSLEMLSDEHARAVAAVLGTERVPRLFKSEAVRVAQLLDKWAAAGRMDAACAPSSGGRRHARQSRARQSDRGYSIRPVAVMRSAPPQMFPVIGEFSSLASRSTKVPNAAYNPFRTRQCVCQPLHPLIAEANVMGQLRRFVLHHIQEEVPAGAQSSPRTNQSSTAPRYRHLQFCDHYGALAFARANNGTDGSVGSTNLSHGFVGTYVGCHNVGGKESVTCASSMEKRSELMRTGRAPPLSAAEQAFVKAGADDFCDCTHSGFNPYKLGVLASALADSVERGLEAAGR